MPADIGMLPGVEKGKFPRTFRFIHIRNIAEIDNKGTVCLQQIRGLDGFSYFVQRHAKSTVSVFGMKDCFFQHDFNKKDLIIRECADTLCCTDL